MNGVQGVGGSNPLAPTNFCDLSGFSFSRIRFFYDVRQLRLYADQNIKAYKMRRVRPLTLDPDHTIYPIKNKRLNQFANTGAWIFPSLQPNFSLNN